MTTGTRSHATGAVMCVWRDGRARPASAPSGLGAGVCGGLFLVPGCQRRMRGAGIFVQLVLARCLCGEFEPDAVRIEEVDRLDEAVVGDAEDLHAVRLEPRLHDLDVLHGRNLQREVL